jgi:hypothetical protein
MIFLNNFNIVKLQYMNELERINRNTEQHFINKPAGNLTSLEIYDTYAAMAYGIILQIIPQPHLAQEVLISVFSSPLLQSCNSYPFTFAVCIIKLARAKAVEAKRKLSAAASPTLDISNESADKSPQRIFDLAFCQGFSPEEVAEKLNIPKSEVLRSIHAFFKLNRDA